MADLGKILLMPKGEYDPNYEYSLLDVVLFHRDTFVLKVPTSLGVDPTDTNTWQLMSPHGEDAFGFGYIMYSEYPDGTDFVAEPTADTIYIGFYMGDSVTPPTDKTFYKWSKYVGLDGVSPSVKITKTGNVATITIKDKDGETSETLTDGINGNSLTASHRKIGKTTTVTIKDSNTGSTIDTFTVEDGADGGGSGDMLKSVYDVNQNGFVDNSEAITNGVNRMTYSDINTALDSKIAKPTAQGTNGQALITDGQGNYSWGDVATDQYIESTTNSFDVTNKELDLAQSVKTSLDKADTAYQKKSGGIPKTDLASAVQTSLGKADSAYQKPADGIPKADLSSEVTEKLSEIDNKVNKTDAEINVRTVKRIANKFTERLEFTISANDTEYPKWQNVDDPSQLVPIGDASDPNMIVAKELYEASGEHVEFSFLFDSSCNQPIYLGGYQYISDIGDGQNGAIAIKLGNSPDTDINVAIDITHIKEVIDNG